MKKLTMFFLLITVFISSWSVRQPFSSIERVADHYVQQKMQGYSILETYPVKQENVIKAYVFNLEPAGFIAVSADSQIPPVIAYSFRNRMQEDDSRENLFYQMMAEDIQNRLAYYQLNPQDATGNKILWEQYLQNEFHQKNFQQWPPAGTTITDGWVETAWNQSGVYNQFCPIDNSGQRSVVGCVATAMAMIIDYHRYVGNVNFTNADDYYSGYSYPYILIDNDHAERDFPSFPELNVLMNDVKNRYLNNEELTGTDKAALSFACGIVTEMNYSSQGSGTWTALVAPALLNKFGYESAQHIENYGSSFYNTLKQNMKTMKPAEMSIYTSGWNNGHAIICDGYNTDDFYHLNYGWGTSNATCWYSLPYGMPYNYSIIGGAVVNIQGGESPLAIQGQVNVTGVSPVGTYIRFEGEHVSEVFVTSTNGTFDIPAIWPGNYTVTAFLEGRFYYQSFEVDIHTNNQFISFHLDEFDQVDGVVNAPVNTENSVIHFYQDGALQYSGAAGANGHYSIPEVFPGIYTATASLAGGYFQSKEIEITADNQTVHFDLEHYPGVVSLAYSSHPTDIFTFLPDFEMSLGIKVTSDEWLYMGDDVLANVRFLSPIYSDEGELYAQIWQGNDLLDEIEISEFSKGEWVEAQFGSFMIDNGEPYFVGYKINTHTENYAYHDDTEKVTGKGSFLRISHWTEFSDALLSNNLCIEAEFLSQSFGTVHGSVILHGNSGNLTNVAIKAGSFIAHPQQDGSFSFDLKPGTYEVVASHAGYDSWEQSFMVEENSIVEDVFIELFSTSADDIMIPEAEKYLINYPNPFNPSTTIEFSRDFFPHDESVTMQIFNLKGQQVRKIKIESPQTNNKVVWNGRDDSGNPVGSAIYLYQLSGSKKTSSVQKMLLLK